jgi:hypothetical protein
MRVLHDLARIVPCTEASFDERVEGDLFGASHLDGAVHRLADGDFSDRAGDVGGSHRLGEHMREVHRVAVGGGAGDALEELEELRRMDERIRDGRRLDQRLLSGLRAKVTAVGQTLGAHDGQRDVMPHAGDGLRREQIPGRRLKKRHGRLRFQGRGVRDVHHRRGARQDLGQTRAGDGVDARVG